MAERYQSTAPLAAPLLLRHAGPHSQYHITFPTFNAHNLLMGTLRTEIGGECCIVCAETNCRANFTFHQKPFWGGEDKINYVTVDVLHGSSVEAKLSGYWNGKLHLQRPASAAKEETLDVATCKIAPKLVLPLSKQGPWESRRLWAHTTALLNHRPDVDWAAVDAEKGRLEEDQRLLACHKDGDEFEAWPTKLFEERDYKNPVTGKTEQVWTFKHFNAAPYEEGETPVNLLKLSHDTAVEDSRNSDPAQSAGAAGEYGSKPVADDVEGWGPLLN